MRLISVFNAFAPGFCTSVLYLLFQFKEIGRSGTHKDKNYLKKHLSKSTAADACQSDKQNYRTIYDNGLMTELTCIMESFYSVYAMLSP